MYCWGHGWCGQLGLGGGEPPAGATQGVPFGRMDPSFPQGVLQVACGDRHSLFLLLDGTLLSCGDNSRGQLGRKSGGGDPRRGQIQALEAQIIASVSCGKEHSLAVCNRGRVFAWGAGSQGQLGTGGFKEQSLMPKRIDGLSSVIVIQVACGNFHSIALSKDGRAFSWGQNSDGQLGLGNKNDPQHSPQHIASLYGVPLAQIAAGGSHSMALCLSGAVFGWGKNNVGQLGFHSLSSKGCFRPRAIDALRDLDVIYLTCGDEHTAVLTTDGSVFTFGDNSYGQLGHDALAPKTGLQKPLEITGRVSQIACGSYHTLIYSATCGQIISFGRGAQRHIEKSSSQQQPLPSSHSWDFDISSLVSPNDFLDLHVKKIFAGAFVSFANTVPEPQSCSPPDKTFAIEDVPSISQMDRNAIVKWMKISAGSESCQEAKGEIVEIFSSPACLTASFMKRRSSSPLQTSFIDVDLEAAGNTLAELSTIEWIYSTMSYCLRARLLPELPRLSSHPEALALFLLLPELPCMTETQDTIDVAYAFAYAINELSESSFKILEKLWTSLPATFLNKQVQMLKGAIIQGFKIEYFTPKLHEMNIAILEMMKKLFKANSKANFPLELNKFYIDDLSQHHTIYSDVVNWLRDLPITVFCRFPFTLNVNDKIQAVNIDSFMKQEAAKIAANEELTQNRTRGSSEMPKYPLFHLKVNRSNLAEDTFYKLSHTEDCDLRKQLLVEFSGEPPRGNFPRTEFFLYLFEEIFHPDYGLFIQRDKYSPLWFPANPTAEKKKYFFCGILCGLAIFSGTIAYIPLPLAHFKKLLDKKPTLVDLSELDPVLARSLQNLLDCEFDDTVKRHEVYFSASWDNTTVDLIPQGSSIAVDNKNKKDYVSKYIDYIFNKSVAEVFEEFKRGYYKVCDKKIMKLFQPQELLQATRGTTDYVWSDLEKNALYWGEYHASHPTIEIFWKVFHELQLPEKRAFLLFVTGIDRMPASKIDLRIKINSHASLTEQHLPEAQPCLIILFLPRYSTCEILKEKLLLAISHNRGFFKSN